MRRTLQLLLLLSLLSGPLFAQNQAHALAQASSPVPLQPAHGEKLHVAGIPNAGKINELLYRGAQPREQGLSELKKLGITTIIDLRGDDPEKIQWERRLVESLGMRFLNIPVSGWSTPTDEQLGLFLSLLRTNPRDKIFVHCRFGQDRTGVFIATYRMTFDKWTAEQAMYEMNFFGFSGFWHPGMKTFIRDFPARLNSAPVLAALVKVSS